MGTLKYTVGSALASASLFLAPAVPVAADTNNSNNSTTTNTTTTTRTINIGDCAVRFDDIKVWLDQYDNTQINKDTENEVEDDVDGTNNQSNSNSQSMTNSQSVVITVAPNCSVTNVQPAVAGGQGGAVLGAQAEAGKGGVGAGFGAAPSLFASAGAAASALVAGLGIRRLGN